jgi:dTDP-4-dehydrorhamnose 3,5-epimerase
MTKFEFEKTQIEGLILGKAFSVDDERGLFSKYYEKNMFHQNGIDLIVNECFESHSKKGVIRGLHFQTENPQAKLIYVNYGAIFDVAVDLRKSSKTYGEWQGFCLSSKERNFLYIPKGFAHGFLALDEENVVTYVCEGEYIRGADSGIVWNDCDVNVDWPLQKVTEVIVSEKDQKLQSFKGFDSAFGGFGL